jgi:nitroreductase
MSDVLPLSPDELLTTTRSVRRRLDLERPVPIEVVREALQVALQAPTGSNAQTWHWIVVTDAEKRQAIASLYARSFARYRASGGRTYADPTRQAVQQRV